MFWGERGEDGKKWEEGMNEWKKEIKEKDEQERSYCRLVFLLL